MKKLLLLLMIVPMIGFGQSPSIQGLIKAFGGGVCGYYDDEGEMLFDGGDFNIKSPDVAKVSTYGCIYGGWGEPTMYVTFDVLNDGSKQLRDITFWASEEGTMPNIYFDLNRYLLGED